MFILVHYMSAEMPRTPARLVDPEPLEDPNDYDLPDDDDGGPFTGQCVNCGETFDDQELKPCSVCGEFLCSTCHEGHEQRCEAIVDEDRSGRVA